jgi:hypothetical protein
MGYLEDQILTDFGEDLFGWRLMIERSDSGFALMRSRQFDKNLFQRI